MSRPRVAVCLSGCGYLDGAEIQEAVLTLLALDQAGAEAVCCAPDIDQAKVVDHRSGEPVAQRRNVLAESARIARGKIVGVSEVDVDSIDALVIPGGFGAALNLCDFAAAGPDCRVDPGVEAFIKAVHKQGKPIGAICIAPALLGRVLGRAGVNVKLTIGDDTGTAAALEQMGVTHRAAAVTEAVTDLEHKVASTPAYMLGQGPAEVFEGIRKCVDSVLAMVAVPTV
ncbi:isoprenoid biosynthesis glyoxalase ElbB [Isosphaeraceae bacterium EP7]